MQYLISFLEGVITFLSPCLLPLLPVYVSYFAGGGERTTRKTLTCALGFVAGFTAVFVAMGALAGTIGSLLAQYRRAVNLVSGILVILFGLNYLGLFRWNLFHGGSRVLDTRDMGFFFRCNLWCGFLTELDTLCGRIPRLCADAGLSGGTRERRNDHAASLLAGAGNSLPPQRRAD